MSQHHRDRFDSLLEAVIEELPPGVRGLIEEVPVIALDRPTPRMLRDLGADPTDEDDALSFCGLHTGTADTERSVEHSGDLPSDIHLFREGIVDLAVGESGGWDAPDAEEIIRDEIRITLLHEIGHQFGLDEDDLDRLGYQ